MLNRIVSWAASRFEQSEQKAMKEAFASQDWQKFLEINNRLIEKNPKDHGALCNAALAYINLVQPEKALERIDAAMQLNCDMGYCYYLRGLAHQGLNNLDEAVEDCTKAIELGQTHQGSYLVRMLARTHQYKYEEALKDIEHVIAHCPNFKPARIHKAFTLHSMYRDKEALDLCNEVIDTLDGSDLVFALAIRAYASSRLGKLDMAVADMEKALNIAESKDTIYLDLAQLRIMQKDIAEARKCIELAKPVLKRDIAIKCMQNAKVSLLEGDNELGLKYAEEAVEICPRESSMRAIRGLSLARLGHNEEALLDLNFAAEADPFCMDARWFREKLLDSLGSTEEAERDKNVTAEYGYIPYL